LWPDVGYGFATVLRTHYEQPNGADAMRFPERYGLDPTGNRFETPRQREIEDFGGMGETAQVRLRFEERAIDGLKGLVNPIRAIDGGIEDRDSCL
jgi:hypothetical protein